jgi:hypothetical protein
MRALGLFKAAMASQLSVIEKKQLVEHKIALQEDGIALTYKDQVAYCQENFGKSLSSTTISKIWTVRAMPQLSLHASWQRMPATLGQMWSSCLIRRSQFPSAN